MAAVTRRDFLSLSAVAAALGFAAVPAAAATTKPTCRTCATPTPTATATPTASASGISTSTDPLADIHGVMRFDTAAGAALRVSPDGVLHVKALVIHPD